MNKIDRVVFKQFLATTTMQYDIRVIPVKPQEPTAATVATTAKAMAGSMILTNKH